MGASLLPAGIQPILGLPARLFGETIAHLCDLIGSTAHEVEERVLSCTGVGTLARMGDALLRLRASRDAQPVITRAIHSIRRSGGQLRMNVLADETNLSIRQLQRAFLEHVGFSPKTYSRLVRFDRVARAIAARGTVPWSRFALVHGYSDQAHLINEFKEFASITPAQFESELTMGVLSPSR